MSPYLSVFSPNAGKCRKNADQINFEYGHFLRSDSHHKRSPGRWLYLNEDGKSITTCFIVLTKTRNKPKRPETSRNDAQKLAKRLETTQNFKIISKNHFEIWNFVLAFVFQVSSPNAQIWVFWPKKCQLPNLHETSLYAILNVLISKLSFVFESFELKGPNLGILS